MVTKEGSPYRRQALDFLSDGPLDLSGFLDYTEDTRIAPHEEIRAGTLAVIEADQYADVPAEIGHSALQCITWSLYCCYGYPHFSAARVIFRDYEHGSVAAQVKKAYLDLENSHGPEAPKYTLIFAERVI